MQHHCAPLTGTSGWGRGLVAGLAGLAASEAVASVTRTRSFVDAAGQVVVDRGPVPVVERTVQLLRTADKPVIRAAVAATVLAAGGLLGRATRRPARDIVAVGAAAAIGAVLCRRRAADDLAGTDQRVGAGLAAGSGALGVLGVLAAPPAVLAPAAIAGAVGLAAAMSGQSRRRLQQDTASARLTLRPPSRLPAAVDGAEDWPGASPLLTPIEDFYVTDTNMRAPVIDLRRWRLAVTGAVGTPLLLSYDELLGLGLVEFDAAMVCIHNRVGAERLGNTRWLGIPLCRLLAGADPGPSGSVLVTRAVDGFECSMPRRLLDELDSYVVVGMAGRALTAAHGFPARVFIPGLYGQYTGAKWLTELRLQAHPNRDYWLPRGWAHGPVRVRSLSRIDAPTDRTQVAAGPTDVVGVAWAPPGGLTAVHLAVDDQPWTTAELATELAPAAWRRWRAQVALAPGQHRLRVRCVARDRTIQDPTLRPPFPTGATGYHTIAVSAV
jgi:DMSO/TMAO reductase YedYZ molybdopterin-dependent catalytic subunit